MGAEAGGLRLVKQCVRIEGEAVAVGNLLMQRGLRATDSIGNSRRGTEIGHCACAALSGMVAAVTDTIAKAEVSGRRRCSICASERCDWDIHSCYVMRRCGWTAFEGSSRGMIVSGGERAGTTAQGLSVGC